MAACTEVHLRPISLGADAGDEEADSFYEAIAAIEEGSLLEVLRQLVGDGKLSCGDIFDFSGRVPLEVAVCSIVPSAGGRIVDSGSSPTQVVWSAEPVPRLRRLQMHCLDNDARGESEENLYHDYLKPFLMQRLEERKKRRKGPAIFAVKAGRLLTLRQKGDPAGKERAFAARHDTMDPAGQVGAIDSGTELFTRVEDAAELVKIDVRPYQDTLPSSYEVDIFQDYLRPYFDQHRFVRFTANDHFSFQGVRFRVLATDPPSGGRVGSSSLVFSKGSLQPSLIDRLPPELLDDLRRLPRGLQVLLLSTMERDDTMAQIVEAQSVQDVLKKGNGLTDEQLQQLEPPFPWTGLRKREDRGAAQEAGSSAVSSSSSHGALGRVSESATPTTEEEVCLSCMVCLCDFEDRQECRRLPCRHAFHRKCVDEWLRRSPVCPVCKAEPIEGASSQAQANAAAAAAAAAAQGEQGSSHRAAAGSRVININLRPRGQAAPVREADVQTLVSMGVQPNEAKQALQRSGGDLQLACQIIWPE